MTVKPIYGNCRCQLSCLLIFSIEKTILKDVMSLKSYGRKAMLAKPDSFPNACFQYKNHHSTNASILTKLQGTSRPMGDLNTPATVR